MHSITRDTMVDGRYRAERKLGSGGMAEVWCAQDEVLGRRVALKLMGGRFAESPEFRERFRREAQAAAGLTHPNIVAIFDRSEWDGTPYIAMELVDGRTLKELVTERGPLPPEIAISLTEQILRALGYAHRRGIVHRDIKPQNVILDGEGQAKVADFGIARAGETSEMTQTGAIVGTVQYLSPEQAEGHPVDRRADLYSAGIVLYELLTGQVPFDGEAPISIAIKQINEPPVPPRQLEPGIPPALEDVVLRALEKDPGRRFQSAEEFVAALERARHAPARPVVLDPTPGEPWVDEEEPKRTRWWIWALALLAVAAIGVGAYLLLAGTKVTVPNLVGRQADEVDPILERRGLEVAFVPRESDDVPRDEVISQDPVAGEEVREGTTVSVVISAGRGEVPVPAVEGESREDAQRALEDAGFKVKVEEANSDDVPEGDVISSSPAGGTPATKGRTVTITVSSGPSGIAVPKVVGLQRDEAEAQLEAAGLRADVTEQETTQPPGTVMKQDPASGARVDRGATVALTVAKARPEVPDVTGSTEEEATAALEQAGFKVQTRDRADPSQVGVVVDQDPDPGTPRSTGATVTIFVGVGDQNAATPTPTPTPTP